MSNDLQADIVTNLKGDGLTKATSGTEKLASATQKANRSAKDYQAAADKAFKSTATNARSAEVSVDNIGRALSKLGGPAGALVRSLSGGAGLTGALSSVALAAGVAGVALRSLMAISDRAMERARNTTTAYLDMQRALRAGNNALRDLAREGGAQVGDARQVIAAGGEDALKQADAITRRGLASPGEAYSGVASIYRNTKNGSQAAYAMSLAESLAEAGMPFAEAAAEVSKAGSRLEAPNGPATVGARVYAKYSNYRGPDPKGHLVSAIRRTRNSQYLVNATADAGIRNQNAAEARGASEKYGVLAALDDVKTADSVSQAPVNDLRQRREEEISILRDQVAVQNEIVAAIRELGSLLGGQGSARQQLRQLQRDYSE